MPHRFQTIWKRISTVSLHPTHQDMDMQKEMSENIKKNATQLLLLLQSTPPLHDGCIKSIVGQKVLVI